MADAIWISWERHRRTRELCRALDVELCELTSGLRAPLKYLPLVWRTVSLIARRRPGLLFVQCPSVVLGVCAVMLSRLFGCRLVADLHNEAVEPINSSSRLYLGAFRFIRRAATLNIVTNSALEAVVTREGSRAFVLPDRIPDLAPGPPSPGRAAARVVFICTYAVDEPVAAVIAAARLLGPDVEWLITGDLRRARGDLQVPAHVRLTDFLPAAAYEQLLRDADVIVDLTTLDNCLVCGAYEAVALEKPLVTSDTLALRRHFRMGTMYAAADASSIAGCVDRALQRREALAAEMRLLKRELATAWARQAGVLRERLASRTPAMRRGAA